MNDEPKVDAEDTQEIITVTPLQPGNCRAWAQEIFGRRVEAYFDAGEFEANFPTWTGRWSREDALYQLDLMTAYLEDVKRMVRGDTPKPDPDAELSAALEAYIVADSEYQREASEWCATEVNRTATLYKRLSHARKTRAAAANQLGRLFPHGHNMLGMRVLEANRLAIRLNGHTYIVIAAMLPIPHLTGELYTIKVGAPPEAAP